MPNRYEAKFSIMREVKLLIIAVFFIILSIIMAALRSSGAGVCLLIAVMITVWGVIDFLRFHLILSDNILRGTIRASSLIKVKTVSLPIQQITSVEINQDVLGKLLDYGTLSVTTPSGNVSFKYVKYPKELETMILQIM